VSGWRNRYLAARRDGGVRDFGVFNFRFGNRVAASDERRAARNLAGRSKA
jgi:hypothetical protein